MTDYTKIIIGSPANADINNNKTLHMRRSIQLKSYPRHDISWLN